MSGARNTMSAAVLYNQTDLRVEQRPIPRITDNEVLLRSHAAAICGTDIRIYKHGHSRLSPGTRRILGHEMAGEVVEVGAKVSSIQPGMRVALAPNFGCGLCRMCLRGWFHLCADYGAVGLTEDGGFAEYVCIPDQAVQQGALLKLPDAISYEQAAINEPLACVYNGFLRCPVQLADTVLVVGAGPIGLMHIMLVRAAGAGRIIAAETSPQRMEQAIKFGADHCLDSSQQAFAEQVDQITCGHGADVIIIACPSSEMQELSLQLAADHARINYFGGLPKGQQVISFDSNQVHYKELTVTGSHGCSTFHCAEALKLQQEKKVDLQRLVSETFPLKEANAAFDCAMKGNSLKTIIKP
jgi:L-iditol 2-dehydrogenase